MVLKSVKIKNGILPDSPGAYLMKNGRGKILYVGKAGNLKRRVSSYFTRPRDARIRKLVREIRRIDYKKTETAIEALILESYLIKKYQPPFNIIQKDDKSFLYVEITNDEFPRVLLVRGKDIINREKNSRVKIFGPFTSSASVREALRILRRIFPWSVHPPQKTGKFARPCLEYEIGLCPGVCTGIISKTEYKKNIQSVKLFFAGHKKRIIQNLKKEMRAAGKTLKFEKAEKIKRQLFSLRHIQDVALIEESRIKNQGSRRKTRIEGYDISNISGAAAAPEMFDISYTSILVFLLDP